MKVQSDRRPTVSLSQGTDATTQKNTSPRATMPESTPSVKGEITALTKDDVTIKLSNGQQISGKLTNPEEAELGMTAEFAMRKGENGAVLLEVQPTAKEVTLESRLTDTLKSFGFKADGDHIELVKNLMNNDFPVTKEMIQKLNQAVKLMGKENIDKALFFLENEMNINVKNADTLQAYTRQETKIDNQINDFVKNILGTDNKAVKQLLADIILGKEGRTPSNAASTAEDALTKDIEAFIQALPKAKEVASTPADTQVAARSVNDTPVKELLASNDPAFVGLKKLLESSAPEFRTLRLLIQNKELSVGDLKDMLQNNAPEVKELKKYLDNNAPVTRELQKFLNASDVDAQPAPKTPMTAAATTTAATTTAAPTTAPSTTTTATAATTTAPTMTVDTNAADPRAAAKAISDTPVKEMLTANDPAFAGLKKLVESGVPEFRPLRLLIQNKDVSVGDLKDMLQNNTPEVKELKKYLDNNAPIMRELQKLLNAIDGATQGAMGAKAVGNTPVKDMLKADDPAFVGLKKLLTTDTPEFSGLKYMIDKNGLTIGDLKAQLTSGSPITAELKKYIDMNSPNTRELKNLLESLDAPPPQAEKNAPTPSEKPPADTQPPTEPKATRNGYESLQKSVEQDVFEKLDALLKQRMPDASAAKLFLENPEFHKKVSQLIHLKTDNARQLADALSFDANNKNVDDLEKFINELSSKLETMKHVPEGESKLSKNIEELQNNLKFMSEVKNNVYVQIPFQFQDNKTTGELYIFKDKRSKQKKEGDTQSALLALDLVSLGHFEAYIQKTNKSVKCQFRIDNEQAEKAIKHNIRALAQKLSEHQYSLDYYGFKEIDESFTVVDKKPTIEEEVLPAETKKFIFDRRT